MSNITINENCDYDIKNEEEILTKANGLIKLDIQDILNQSKIVTGDINIRNKGIIGTIIEEHWFGFNPNSSPAPDFEDAGIELKVIPLTHNKDKKLIVKERTKICSIKYENLYKEEWGTSHAKKKLNKILFIYYHYDKENIEKSEIKKVDLWTLKGNDKSIIISDWHIVKGFVSDGKAHELSEKYTKTLAASRSGSGGAKPDGTLKDAVTQPIKIHSETALKRAFSLKQSFTNQRWNEINKEKYESILDILSSDSQNLEADILTKLSEIVGLTLGQISKKFHIKVPQGKNAAATIIKKSIGFRSVNSKIKEFEQIGIQVKTFPVREQDLMPWEAVSFPAFKFKELIKENFFEGENEDTGEEWEECSLLQELNRILFIPIFRENRSGVALKNRVIGKPFFWSPSSDELIVIEKEWNNYIKEINEGKVKTTLVPHGDKFREISDLSKESKTKIIHIRPHAQDSMDRDEDHLGNSISKQSFWLNKKFLQKLLKNNYNN